VGTRQALKDFWQEKHEEQDISHLSDVSAVDVFKQHELYMPFGARVADIGYGTGRFAREIGVNNEVVSFDIAELPGVLDISELNKQAPFDLGICHLVAQHNPLAFIHELIPPLKPGGIFSILFLGKGESSQTSFPHWLHSATDMRFRLSPMVITNEFCFPCKPPLDKYKQWVFRCSPPQ